jgi:hypothetical protein
MEAYFSRIILSYSTRKEYTLSIDVVEDDQGFGFDN